MENMVIQLTPPDTVHVVIAPDEDALGSTCLHCVDETADILHRTYVPGVFRARLCRSSVLPSCCPPAQWYLA